MSSSHGRPLAILRRCLFLLRLLFLLSWASCGSKLAAYAQCLPDQSAALLRLKQGFNLSTSFGGGGGPSVLPSWRAGTDCCQGWTGVTCGGASGRVVGLHLSGSSISGELDPALFNLTSLQSLDLSCNQFNRVPIPSRGFDMLRNLTHLNLSDSGFDGQIPIGISRLTLLTSLDLSAYNLCSTSSLRLRNLKNLVADLHNLQQLYLNGVNISAGGGEWGPALSSSVPKLRELSLSGCLLSGPIDSSLSKLTSLTLLRLDQNNLTSEVPEFLGNLPSLSLLRLSSCGLHGQLPRSIFALRHLGSLDVSRNPKLSGQLPDFPVDSVLENLLLFETNLSGRLPDSIGKLHLLKTLRLANCNFSGSMPASFGNLTQLVYVDLSLNSFSGPIPSFEASANLTVLDLQNNSLTGPVPAWLFKLTSLQTLQLNVNQLSGELGEFSAGDASLLQTVDLSSNKLQGPIPRSFSNLRGAKVLRFASNRLNGTVGLDLFGNLRNLSILDLSNNMLTLETKSSISFPNVSTLNLASCNLVDFPGLLKTQTKLSRLDLSNNSIGGVVPSWLWSVGSGTLAYLNLSHNSLTGFEGRPDFSTLSLSVLDIRSNKLAGSIPPPPTTNFVVDYSNNRFTGGIPPNISSSLSFTIFFSVSNNRLTGTIPDSICSASYLQVLDLSLNNLSGPIPPCLFAGENDFRVLNLRDNLLSGSLPQFGEVCKLRTLNLNGNGLEGAVPRSLSNCSMLQVLDLGNNLMEGKFPFWLGAHPDLRVLVLRSNKFYGTLPTPPGDKYNFSVLQIMDISSNGFTGRLPSACFSRWKAMTVTDPRQPGVQVGVGVLELTHLYYQDTVTVTVKGLEMTLVKILTIFTSIDMSNNRFEGIIPPAVGQLKALYLLNLSYNGLTGQIPSDIGSLRWLESLDLSRNNLSGKIPSSLATLSFLSALNLSNNQLEGPIPQGGQFATFSNACFAGNLGLCGWPLSKECSNGGKGGAAYAASKSLLDINWECIFIGLGFGGGLALVLGPFVFWRNGRRWYNKHVDRFLSAVVPHGLWPCSDCKDGKVDAEEKGEDGPDAEDEDGDPQRRFCVFCTRLEFIGGRAIIRHVQCSCTVDD